MCVCSAAGPPGVSPASTADRAGSQHGCPEQVCSAGGGAEEVSDGHHAVQAARLSAKRETCTASVFVSNAYYGVLEKVHKVWNPEIRKRTAAGSRYLDAGLEP